MMIRVNDEYLDFDGDIEIEVQIKLFEKIQTSNGDYSYSFDLPTTNHNFKLLGLPFPDTIKSIYNNVDCDIIDNSGYKIHKGSLQVNRVSNVISCTFFGGNTQWFNRLNSPMNQLALRKYDIDLTDTNIMNSWANRKGLVFPIIDTGALVTRSFQNLKVEDFTSCIYVKDLMQDIFGPQGIKLEGDLLKDEVYNNAVITSNGKSSDDVVNRSSYVKKTSQQTGITAATKITFQDETTFPFFDGSIGNFASSTYTADIKMVVDVSITAICTYSVGPLNIFLYKNGAQIAEKQGGQFFGGGATITVSLVDSVQLEVGDTLEVYASAAIAISVNVGSTFKITPTFLYRVFGSSSVPRWTQLQFVSNIFRLLNALPSFNSESNTLTVNLFKDIKSKEAIDISDDIEIQEIDYSEFVSSYAKRNIFSYQEGSTEDLREYNISNFISYGSGAIEIDNDFIDNESDVLESDFTSPITYLNSVFDMSMERINYVELDEVDDKNITAASSGGDGLTRLSMSNADELFSADDLVGVETTVEAYNGQWVVAAVTTTYIVIRGVDFTSTATGTATLLRHKFTTENDVYLFVNVPTVQNLTFSSNYSMVINDAPFTFTSFAYFNLLSNGRQINTKYKQSLSFGSVNNPLSYQLSLLDTYWGIFSDILSDPVMLKVNGYFHQNKYMDLKTFMQPVRIKINETNNLYYLNRNRGYKDKSTPCYNELIKL